MKWRRIVFASVVALVGVGVVADQVVRRIAARELVNYLTELYGGRLEVDRASIGWSGMQVHGLRLFETSDAPEPWFAADRLEGDLTLLEAIKGNRMPRHITLRKPMIHLRLNREGRVATSIPVGAAQSRRYPDRIDFRDGSLRLAQPERRDFIASGLNLVALSQRDEFSVDGKLNDKNWGDWTIASKVNLDQGAFSSRVATSGTQLDTARLGGLPLVPKELDEVRMAGRMAGELRLSRTRAEGVRYRLGARIENGTLSARATNLAATNLNSELELQDGIARLAHFAADLASGWVQGSATADLREVAKRKFTGRFQVRARDVAIEQIAKAANQALDVKGRASATADMTFAMEQGAANVTGRGAGVVQNLEAQGVKAGNAAFSIEAPAELKPNAPASGIHFQITLPQVEISRAAQRFAKDIDPLPRGFISVQAAVDAPLNALANPPRYRARGTFTSEQIAIEPIQLRNVRGSFAYDGGILQIRQLIAKAPNGVPARVGTLVANATLALVGEERSTADVSLVRVPLDPLLEKAGLEKSAAVLSGRIQAQAPRDQLGDPAAWIATGQLRLEQIRFQELRIALVRAQLQLNGGLLQISKVQGAVADTHLAAAAQVRLQEPYPFLATVDVPTLQLDSVIDAASDTFKGRFQGEIAAKGSIRGSLRPLKWETEGEISAPAVRVGGIQLTSANAQWRGNQQRVEVGAIRAELLGGRVQAQAVGEPLARRASLQGKFEQIDFHVLARQLELDGFRLSGRASGAFEAALADTRVRGALRVSAPLLTARGARVDGLSAALEYSQGRVSYNVEARAAGGAFNASGQAALPHFQPPSELSGKISLRGAQLNQLVRAFSTRDVQPPLEAAINLEFEYQQPRGMPVRGNGQFELARLRWDRAELMDRLSGQLRLNGTTLRLTNVNGRVGEGSIRALARIELERPSRNRFRIWLDRVPAANLLAPWPEIAREVHAPLSGELSGSLGRYSRGTGSVSIPTGRIFGAEIESAQIPIEWTASMTPLRLHADLRNSTAQLARGRAVANTSIDWDRTPSVRGRVSFTALELRQLLGGALSIGRIGTGRLSGRVDLRGDQMQSINDLAGTFQANLTQAQAMQFPVLREVSRFVLPGQQASIAFDSGRLRGRFARGVVRVEQFALVGNNTQLYVNGNVTYAGRLALNVTARQGRSFAESEVLRLVGLPSLQAAVIPIPALTSITDFLSNRVIYLRVGGTVRSPSIRLRPLPLLEQEAALFFLTSTTAGLGLSQDR